MLRLQDKNQRTYMSSNGKYKLLFKEITELIEEGHTPSFIRNRIRQSNPNISDQVYTRIHESAIRPMQRELMENRDLMQIQHFARYDRDRDTILQKITKAENADLFADPRYIYKAVEMYGDLIDMIRQKEKLFGLHKKIFKIRLHKYVGEQLNGMTDINIKALSPNEQIELLRLLKKAKSDEYVEIKFNQDVDYTTPGTKTPSSIEDFASTIQIPTKIPDDSGVLVVHTHKTLQQQLQYKSAIPSSTK